MVDRCMRTDSSPCDPSRITLDLRSLVIRLGSQLESFLTHLSTIRFSLKTHSTGHRLIVSGSAPHPMPSSQRLHYHKYLLITRWRPILRVIAWCCFWFSQTPHVLFPLHVPIPPSNNYMLLYLLSPPQNMCDIVYVVLYDHDCSMWCAASRTWQPAACKFP